MSYRELTRAQIRDQVRRELNQIPPIDDSVGIAGAQPVRWPFPTNINIDKALDKAVTKVSIKCRVGGDPVPRNLLLPAQTANGPLVINLQQLPPFGSVNTVEKVSWQAASTGQSIDLLPGDREEYDLQRTQWQNYVPAVPQFFWVEFGSLLILPAPAASGTLQLMTCKSLWSMATGVDGEVIEIIPSDYVPIILAGTVAYVCRERANDAVLKGIGDSQFAEFNDGLGDIRQMLKRRNRANQTGITADVGRINWGRR